MSFPESLTNAALKTDSQQSDRRENESWRSTCCLLRTGVLPLFLRYFLEAVKMLRFFLPKMHRLLLKNLFLLWFQEPINVHLDQPGSLTLAMCQLLNEIQESKKGVVTPRELFTQVCKKWEPGVQVQLTINMCVKYTPKHISLSCLLSAELPGSKDFSSKIVRSCCAIFWMGCELRRSKYVFSLNKCLYTHWWKFCTWNGNCSSTSG